MRTRFLTLLLTLILLVPAASADIQFKVTHTDNGAGWNDPTLGKARRDTLQAVLTYLNTVLDENGTIDVQTSTQDYNATGPIASAPTAFLLTPNGFSSGNAFLHARSGVDPNPGSADLTVSVDWGYSLYPSLGTGTPGPGQIDLFTVFLHEVTHGLGFLTRIKSDGKSAVTNTDPGVYTVLDSLDRLGNVAPATPIFGANGDFKATVADLADPTPGIYFWGAGGMAATGGKPLKMFQSSPHGLSSGLSHTGQLMGPSLSTSEVYRTYSVRDLGMLRDLGWKLKPVQPKFLGPKTITLLEDTGPNGTPTDNVNAASGGSRFRGTLGGRLLHEAVTTPRPVYDEDASTAAESDRSHRGEFTQVNDPDAPGSIVLRNRDGSHSGSGLTWISPWENFRVDVRPDEKFVVSFRTNPDPKLPDTITGTFLDAIVGATQQEIEGGAKVTDGIGVRLNTSGPHAGRWQIFDGTGLFTRTEASGPLLRGGGLATFAAEGGWYDVAIELLQPSFDDATPVVVNVLIDGELVHTFTAAGGIGDNFVSFQAGPSSDPSDQVAAYLLDDVHIAVEPWSDAPPVVVVGSEASFAGAVGVPYRAALTAAGGTGPYEWWLDGGLPAGLSFTNGVITGTPTQTGTFRVTITAVDYGFFTGSATRDIVIADGNVRRRAVRG